MDEREKERLVPDALRRLCHGLPVRELRLVVEEAAACQEQLSSEVDLLERALQREEAAAAESAGTEQDDAASAAEAADASSAEVDAILGSPLTPLHQYWTASALLGRLRNELALPSLLDPHPQYLPPRPFAAATKSSSSSSRPSSTTNAAVSEERALQGLTGDDSTAAAIYGKPALPTPTLLAVWKKISSNRAAAVFRRAVKPEEAPGYADRIAFAMDLGLVRKRIAAGQIRTLADLHRAVALISHNCVKYNGRESDYGRVAVDFEAMADHVILQAVQQQQQQQQQLPLTKGGVEAGAAAAAGNSAAPAVAPPPPPPSAAAAAAATTTATTTAKANKSTSAKGTKAQGSKGSKASAPPPQQQDV